MHRGPQRPTRDATATLQTRLEVADDGSAASADAATISDPVALLRQLDVSGCFHRDSRAGRLFHRGMVSLRENQPSDSLHVSVDDDRLAAHVDSVSPLTVRPDGTSAYSVRRALAHNLAGMAEELARLLRGREGDDSCELNCEWIAPGAARTAAQVALLDPSTGSWSVQMDARVAGSLDEARLRTAIGVALGRGVFEHDPLLVVDCPDDEALQAARARLHSAPVAADATPPLRACLARRRGGDVLMLSLNHAAGDGFGALQVLESIARSYAGANSAAPLEFLATHDLPIRPAATSTPAAVRTFKRVLERLSDIRDRPALVAEDEPGDEAGCGYHLVALSAEDTRRVVGAAHARANTSVLMAALHLAIAEWNDRHGAGGGRIGVLVQADLRPPEWRDEPVANFSVTARMSTTRADRASPAATLKTISAGIARNKRTRTGVALIAALRRAGLLTLWATQSIVVLQPLTGNHPVDTTVLCNLGRLDEAPSFGPDAGETVELWFSTPARGPLSMCLGAVSVGGRLHLTIRYPRRLLGPDAARRFAACYIDQLRLVGDVACG